MLTCGGSSFRLADNRIEARRITMSDLARMLTSFVDRAVIDETTLTGRYDITAHIAPEDYLPMMIRGAVNGGIPMPPQALRALDGASPDPISGPLQTLGLRIESRRAPLDVLVVDMMLRTPTEN
jgi:uncharacterized protein (TIGR03435 family)